MRSAAIFIVVGAVALAMAEGAGRLVAGLVGIPAGASVVVETVGFGLGWVTAPWLTPSLVDLLVEPARAAGYDLWLSGEPGWQAVLTLLLTVIFGSGSAVAAFALLCMSRVWPPEAGAVQPRQRGLGGQTGAIKLGRYSLHPALEVQHILGVGSTGVGKSQALWSAMMTALKRGQGGLVLDIGGELTSRAYEPERDILIGAYDARNPDWSPLAEIKSLVDVDRVAEALVYVPQERGEWQGYARTLVAGCLAALHNEVGATTGRFLQLVTQTPMADLKEIIPLDHPAQGFLDDGNERMFGSIRGTAGAALTGLSGLDPSAGANSFSILRWVQRYDEEPSWLYVPIPARLDQRGKNLGSLIASFFVDAALSLPESRQRRLWLICDEMGQYPAVASLKKALTLGRKYGLAVAAAVQSTAQLEAAYGPRDAQTLLSCFSSKLIYRCGDGRTAEWASREIGERRIAKTTTTRSISSGGNGSGSSKSSAESDTIERAVLASEIQALPDLHAWIRAGSAEPQRVKVRYCDIGEPQHPPLVLAAWSKRSRSASAKQAVNPFDEEVV